LLSEATSADRQLAASARLGLGGDVLHMLGGYQELAALGGEGAADVEGLGDGQEVAGLANLDHQSLRISHTEGATGRPRCDHDASSGLQAVTGARGVEIVDGATVSVAVVASRTEAELIVGMLRSHGLRAAVSADDAGGQYPQMQIEGVRVLVAPSDEASARRLLAAADDTP